MTIAPAFCPLSLVPLFDKNACPIRGGMLYFYDAETTNPRTVYRDAAMASAHTFPVKTDAFGRIPPIWVGVGSYKVVLNDASNALISVIDDLPGGTDTTAAEIAGVAIGTGMILPAHGDVIYEGWLPLNAKTIGNVDSAGTARADNDTNALFIHLWNKDLSLVVSGGRGISASADWTAAKTITLPDYRGRSVFGVDGMGSSLAGVLTAFSSASANAVGTRVGTESDTTTVDQLPTFTPQITVQHGGAHIHSGSVDSAGAHTHTGTTDLAGSHQHGYRVAQITSNTSGNSIGSVPVLQNALTDPNGDHTHTFTTGSAGAHTHTFAIASSGDHDHAATANPIGSGAAHSKMPPAILAFWHIKL